MSEKITKKELDTNTAEKRKRLKKYCGQVASYVFIAGSIAQLPFSTVYFVTRSIPEPPPTAEASPAATPVDTCEDVPLTTEPIQARTEALLQESIEVAIQQTPKSFVDSPDDIHVEDYLTDTLGMGQNSAEFFFNFKESATAEEGMNVLSEYAKSEHNITLLFGDEAMGESAYTFSPYSPTGSELPQELYDLRQSLSYLPTTLTRDLKLDHFEVRVVESIAGDDDHKYGGLARYDRASNSAVITLTAKDLLFDRRDRSVSPVIMHEIGHIIDAMLNCNTEDPQLDALTPDWITDALRQDYYERGIALPEFITGGAYGVKNQKEEKAGIYDAILSNEEILEIKYPTIKQKTILAWVRLYNLSPDTAAWLWYLNNYEHSDVEELVVMSDTWAETYPDVN